MKSTNKAFTLVELIVVISILAILGTIAFISLQGYSSEARNTKRLSDLKSIQSSITTNVAKNGTALSSFVIADATATISSIALGGATAATQDAADYSAGTPNFAALDMNQSEFQDPTDDSDYAIGFTTL
jgi:prepilin-type N-terminal cleavage/methylation domain-containing protein